MPQPARLQAQAPLLHRTHRTSPEQVYQEGYNRNFNGGLGIFERKKSLCHDFESGKSPQSNRIPKQGVRSLLCIINRELASLKRTSYNRLPQNNKCQRCGNCEKSYESQRKEIDCVRAVMSPLLAWRDMEGKTAVPSAIANIPKEVPQADRRSKATKHSREGAAKPGSYQS